MRQQISLGDITVEVIRKRMRSIRLTVHAPGDRVRISAPYRVSLEALRDFALSKLAWIRKQQVRLRLQPMTAAAPYADGESVLVWGRERRLKVEERAEAPSVELTPDAVLLRVRPGASPRNREAVIEAWHRQVLKAAAPPLFAKWEPVMGVKVGWLFTQRMRSRWGTCNPRSGSIRLNTELVTKAVECLEYVIVHEMTHLLEPSHNRRFKALMSRFMPDWPRRRKALGRLASR
ncbi:MAG: M48 family metallopeptidase [Vicinamibacteria bacterium]|nr:M48 family metallopeptidase [Vicinamibacteria bacterium]